MLGLVESAPLEIESDPLSDPFGEPLLWDDRKMSFDDRGPQPCASLGPLVDQRDQRLPQCVEDLLDLIDRGSFFVTIEHHLVARLARIGQAIGLLLLKFDDPFELRQKTLVVIAKL